MTDDRKLRIFLLVQDDPFFLPKYLPRLLTEDIDVVGGVVLGQRLPSDSLISYLKRYLTLMGPGVFVYLGFKGLLLKYLKGRSLNKIFSKHGVPTYQFNSVNDPELSFVVKKNNVDLLVSIACPQIIRKNLIESTKLGGVNLHGGYLPDFPGVFTPYWNLLSGAKEAGCTVHRISSVVDGGGIIKRHKFPIEENDTVMGLYEKISKEGIPLLIESLKDIRQRGWEGELKNVYDKGKYNSFPSSSERAQFKQMGLRFL